MEKPDPWIELLDWAGELAAVHTEEEVEAAIARRVKRTLLGPWSEPWLLDGNFDIPSFATSNLNLYGDAMVGYNALDWGLTLRGSAQRVDQSTGANRDYLDAKSGGAEGWWRMPGEKLRVELRGAFAGGDTLSIASRTSGSNLYVWEDQNYLRGSLLAALVYQGDEALAGGLWLGAGYQSDSLERRAIPNVSLPNNGGSLWLSDSRANAYLTLEGRLRGEWRFLPGWLALRFRGDGRRASVTRDAYTEVDFAGVKIAGTRSRSYAQSELSTRLFLDMTVAEFVGFTPSIHAGVDAWLYTGETDLPNLVVPVFGVGIKREAW
jgi:hypothetical protein